MRRAGGRAEAAACNPNKPASRAGREGAECLPHVPAADKRVLSRPFPLFLLAFVFLCWHIRAMCACVSAVIYALNKPKGPAILHLLSRSRSRSPSPWPDGQKNRLCCGTSWPRRTLSSSATRTLQHWVSFHSFPFSNWIQIIDTLSFFSPKLTIIWQLFLNKKFNKIAKPLFRNSQL